MSHEVTKTWGLQGKMFEVEYQKGERASLEEQMTKIRTAMETLKKECTHPEHLQKHTYHKFTQTHCVSYWTKSVCANCGAIQRSGDETLMYRVEED